MRTIAFGLDFAGLSTGGSARSCGCRAGEQARRYRIRGPLFRREGRWLRRCPGSPLPREGGHSRMSAAFDSNRGHPDRSPRASIRRTATILLGVRRSAPSTAPSTLGRRLPTALRAPYLVSRLISPFKNWREQALDDRLFETYPAASLKLMKLPWEGYKGYACYRLSEGWVPVEVEEVEKGKLKKNETEEARQRRSEKKKAQRTKNSIFATMSIRSNGTRRQTPSSVTTALMRLFAR